MRIVIGYQDDDSSNAAIDDLRRAGLPETGVEARVLAIAPDVGVPADPAFQKRSPALAWLAQDRRDAVLSEAMAVAERGAGRLRSLMPGWSVEPVAEAGAVHRVLTEAAETWASDLLVVGSHGRGAVGRLFHGSVAQMVVNNCRRSVRIARGGRKGGGTEGGLRILLADDGSPAAESAVSVVAARKWPEGTVISVIFVVELPVAAGAELGPEAAAFSGELVEVRRDLLDYGRQLVEATAGTLKEAGLTTRELVLEGRPRYLLNELAEKEGIDCIFMGARGHRALERFMLGSVAAGVASGAPCSVEITRPE
jgi:nucleotide-binding universal stress UspA family protein